MQLRLDQSGRVRQEPETMKAENGNHDALVSPDPTLEPMGPHKVHQVRGGKGRTLPLILS